jgi:hypothetical protein
MAAMDVLARLRKYYSGDAGMSLLPALIGPQHVFLWPHGLAYNIACIVDE